MTLSFEASFASERLTYRRINTDDAKYREFLASTLAEPALQALSTEMLIRPPGKSELDYLHSDYASALLGVVICLQSADGGCDYIGSLVIGSGGIPGSLAKNRTATLGMTLAKDHRGKGYGREALNWGVDWAFRHGNLHTLELWVYEFNQVAIKLYETVGFIQTGRRREVVYVDRKYYDELFYSITEEEWEAKQRSSQS